MFADMASSRGEMICVVCLWLDLGQVYMCNITHMLNT